MFRKRDPEGRFIFNNVLMNGHALMLEYLVENWVDAHANLPLTLEGNTSVLHQSLAKAPFCRPTAPVVRRNSEGQLAEEKKKYEAPPVTEQSFVRMIRSLVSVKDKLCGAGIGIDS